MQLGLPLVWTAARARGFGIADVVRWMSHRPAELARLAKGQITEGADADFVAFSKPSTPAWMVMVPGQSQ